MKSGTIEIDSLREAARGRWPSILASLGIAVPSNPKEHAPCPMCGEGTDRFRFDNKNDHGTWICSQCPPKAGNGPASGDGFALVQHTLRLSFPDTLRKVEEALGMPSVSPRNRLHPSKPDLSSRICDMPPGKLEQTLFLYTNATGRPAIYVQRIEIGDGKKVFSQWGPTPNGERWQNNLDHALKPRPLYRLTMLRVDRDTPVILHEGEKAVHAAITAGLPGVHTTTLGGAKNPHLSDFSSLKGRVVFISPDHDADGRVYRDAVARLAIDAGAQSIFTVQLPGLPPKGDVVEWLSAGGTPNQFQALLDQAEQFVFVSFSKTGTLHEREFSPLPVGDFLDLGEEDEAVDWILDEYLPAGGLALLAGKPKEGKTTLTYELAVCVAKGWPFLSRSSSGGGVLILALEEHPRDVRLRLRALGADALPNLFIFARQVDPTPDTFEAIRRFVIEHAIKLVLLDTLGTFWKVRDENDAAEVTQAMKPLLALARDTGACVFLIHHARKSDGSYGDEIRGSGALFAAVDIAMILKRHEVQTQRVLHAVSRYPETPAEIVLELRETGYVALGDPANLNKQARRDKIKSALRQEAEEPRVISIRAGVSLRDTYRLLGALVENKEAIQEGKGRKGSPFRYAQNTIHATPPVLGGTLHETNSRQTEFDSCSPPSPCMNENSTIQFVEVIEDAS